MHKNTRINGKLDKNNTFLTADLHFFHTNIIKYSSRPFKNVDEMTEGLISNWNAVTNAHSKIFIIGDVAMGGPNKGEELAQILSRLNGDKYLVPGNHDTYILNNSSCLEHITVLPPLYDIYIDDKEKQSITLCHYAMKVWNGSNRGAWHLYGHSHGRMPDDLHFKSFDIGVDCNWTNYSPVSYMQIKNRMKLFSKKEVKYEL